jgi:hypothetical protein
MLMTDADADDNNSQWDTAIAEFSPRLLTPTRKSTFGYEADNIIFSSSSTQSQSYEQVQADELDSEFIFSDSCCQKYSATSISNSTVPQPQQRRVISCIGGIQTPPRKIVRFNSDG